VSVSFLTPWAALVGLVGALGVLAFLRARRRSTAVATTLGLPAAGRRPAAIDLTLLGLVAGLVALAAAQPVIARSEATSGRDGTEVLVVVDVTRSMLARRAPTEPTRLDRARSVAKQLRYAIPETRVGIASISDRVLPHLFPTLGANAFAAVLDRAIGIERPPPDRRARRATAFAALGDLGRVAFFRPDTQRRIAVVISDGETIPVDLETLSDRLRDGHVSTIFVQVWRRDEAVFDENGNRDPAYRPDPTSSRSLRLVAGAVGAPVINEGDARGLIEAVRDQLGTGKLVPQGHELVSKELAPQALLAAVLPLGLLLYRRNV
jgi:von Willebrand factor type A domain